MRTAAVRVQRTRREANHSKTRQAYASVKGMIAHRPPQASVFGRIAETPYQCLTTAWEDATTSYIRGPGGASYANWSCRSTTRSKDQSVRYAIHKGRSNIARQKCRPIDERTRRQTNACRQHAMLGGTMPVRTTITGSWTRQTTLRMLRKSSGSSKQGTHKREVGRQVHAARCIPCAGRRSFVTGRCVCRKERNA
jgi:hypothetical protein